MNSLDGTLLETHELFMTIFLNSKQIKTTSYMVDGVVYEWYNEYLMSPCTKCEYEDFIEDIIKNKPLLLELV